MLKLVGESLNYMWRTMAKEQYPIAHAAIKIAVTVKIPNVRAFSLYRIERPGIEHSGGAYLSVGIYFSRFFEELR
jgi:hypothetical protein